MTLEPLHKVLNIFVLFNLLCLEIQISGVYFGSYISLYIVLNEQCSAQNCCIYSKLLDPLNLDGIWIGQDQYRLPIAPLIRFQKPGAEKCQEGGIEGTYFYCGLKKKQSLTWGRNGKKKKK